MQHAIKHNRLVIICTAILALWAILSCQILNTEYLGFVPNAMPKGRIGVFYYVIIKITNNHTPIGDISISQGSLPKGLTLKKLADQNSILVSGTPQETGAFHFALKVWCYGTNQQGQTGTKDYVVTINP